MVRETDLLKLARKAHACVGSERLGRSVSERIGGPENESPGGRAYNGRVKAAGAGESWAIRWRPPAGWERRHDRAGHIEQLEKPSSSHGESPWSKVRAITGNTGKGAEDERVAERRVVAQKLGNAGGAKAPYCYYYFHQEGRQGRDDKTVY